MKTTEKNVEQAIAIADKLVADDNLATLYKEQIAKIKTLLTTEKDIVVE
jgi:ribosomal protein S20